MQAPSQDKMEGLRQVKASSVNPVPSQNMQIGWTDLEKLKRKMWDVVA